MPASKQANSDLLDHAFLTHDYFAKLASKTVVRPTQAVDGLNVLVSQGR
jgi:hypothetical protein